MMSAERKSTDIDKSLRAITSRVRIIKKHTDSIKHLEKQIEILKDRETSLRKRTSLLERRNVRLEELNKLKDEFIGIASHQLRTPATGVKQYINLLLEGYADPLSPSQKVFLEKAHESNDRQLRIIDDLLQVARIDSESFRLEKQKVDITDLLKLVIEDQKEHLKENRQKIEIKKPTRKVIINADADRLHQAFENIIDNAVNYSFPNNKTTIEITNKADSIEIAIIDRGVGIARQDFNKLFIKFSRILNPLSVAVGGSGLGLYWANKVIKMHGGSITVKSIPQKGSTFTVSLPKNK
jgi:signal transduction histidine kinase